MKIRAQLGVKRPGNSPTLPPQGSRNRSGEACLAPPTVPAPRIGDELAPKRAARTWSDFLGIGEKMARMLACRGIQQQALKTGSRKRATPDGERVSPILTAADTLLKRPKSWFQNRFALRVAETSIAWVFQMPALPYSLGKPTEWKPD